MGATRTGDLDGDGDLDALAFGRGMHHVLLNVAPPSQARWDGQADVGQPGDGQTWEDARNWSVEGVPDQAPRFDSPGDKLVFAPPDGVPIELPQGAVAYDLTVERDVTLQGAALTVTSGVVHVDSGATATILSPLWGPGTLEKAGEGQLALPQLVGSMVVRSGTLRAGGRASELLVESQAIVSLGMSTGDLSVDGRAEIRGTLMVDVGSSHNTLRADGRVTLGPHSALSMRAVGPSPNPGVVSLTIATAHWFEGVFRNQPMTGDHLGYGVFAGDATGTGNPVAFEEDPNSVYRAERIRVALNQALPGDANGDGQFDQLDIIRMLEGHKYLQPEPAGWTEGDFTGDGRFDQLDIVAVMQNREWMGR